MTLWRSGGPLALRALSLEATLSRVAQVPLRASASAPPAGFQLDAALRHTLTSNVPTFDR